jgi:1,4-alpha-glucan branching enzyme
MILMQGYLSLILHAHLPFVRHPAHERFLEEAWLYEAMTETYLPLIQVMDGWLNDGMDTRLTLTLTPTLCTMLLDPLLQSRYARHLSGLIELAEKETHRTHWEPALAPLARMYLQRFESLRETYYQYGGNLIAAFRKFRELGKLEIITSAATHALLPLLAEYPGSLRAQVCVARDHYRECFGCDPRGIWLPECGYADAVEPILAEAGFHWFILDTHGLLQARPKPRYGVFAPVFTPRGLAAFGRDLDSARQVWSRYEGYPGDPRYRDFYRDIGFDLDFDYVKSYLPAPDHRGFTGIKYHRITGGNQEKRPYDRLIALQAAGEHAGHFLAERIRQVQTVQPVLQRPPLLVVPYDAELFGHWWYEGPEFLDYFVRKLVFDQRVIGMTTPQEYLEKHPTQQVARPAASSWGAEGYWGVWLNESNAWIQPHLQVAQERMPELARMHAQADGLKARACKQAGRELLLAQASDWPFILRTGTSPEYARKRVKEHLARFLKLHDQLTVGKVDEAWLLELEDTDNLFPEIDCGYWI